MSGEVNVNVLFWKKDRNGVPLGHRIKTLYDDFLTGFVTGDPNSSFLKLQQCNRQKRKLFICTGMYCGPEGSNTNDWYGTLHLWQLRYY